MPEYYKAVKVNGKKYDLHRLIAERKLGRSLKPNEVVHHIDGNKYNNDPDNLCVMSRSEHAKLHLTGRPIPEEQRRKLSEYMTGKPRYSCRKLNREQVFKILQLIDKGIPSRKIAKRLKVSRSQVTNIYYGKTYQDWVEEYRRGYQKGA